MGSMNSLPVVSQVKSLVQAIAGDIKGARETQEDFIRKGIIASQINSLVHSIGGNNSAAREIQKDFGKDMLVFAENTPVVGHITSGVYLAMDEKEKAEEVFLGATKSSVVAVAGMAGAVCGPAAIACGASFALGSNAAWDKTDSVIAKKPKGMFLQIENIKNGTASVGDIFDFAAGQTLTGVGGAIGAKGAQKFFKKNQQPKSVLCRRRRSIRSPLLFDENLTKLSQHDVDLLPKSFHDLEMGNQALMDPSHLLTTIFTTFVILKLMVLGHPDSKPYYDEICERNAFIENCEQNLFEALKRFDREDSKVSTAKNPLEDSLETLMFEMNNMVKNTTVGFNLRSAICLKLDGLMEMSSCQVFLEKGIGKVKEIFKELYGSHLRVKRSGACPIAAAPLNFLQKMKTSLVEFAGDFLDSHVSTKRQFKSWVNTIEHHTRQGKAAIKQLVKELKQKRSKDGFNTIIERFPKDIDLTKISQISKDSAFYKLETKAIIVYENGNVIKYGPAEVVVRIVKKTREVGTKKVDYFLLDHVESSKMAGPSITITT